MTLRTIHELKEKHLKGKRVFLRVDFNVPLARTAKGDGDSWRVARALPTIEYLKERGARVIIGSHLGRPAGKRAPQLRLNAVARKLSKLLNSPVKKIDDIVGRQAVSAAEKLKNGEILLLENLRFHPGEEKNSPKFAAALARLADIYVNDAFGAAHHSSASTVTITKFLPSYAGFLMAEEFSALSKLLRPKKPFVVLIGGAKVSTKIAVIKNLAKKAQAVLLGGALVNAFLKARGYKVGGAKVEAKELFFARNLLRLKNLHIPVDAVVGLSERPKAHGRVVAIIQGKSEICKKNEAIFDIGPATVAAYAERLRRAKTIVWNGPLGMFEVAQYSHGTMSLARLIAARSSGRAFGVVGGGETAQALAETGMAHYVDHVSTGGGAMLEFLEGKILPGIKPLIK